MKKCITISKFSLSPTAPTRFCHFLPASVVAICDCGSKPLRLCVCDVSNLWRRETRRLRITDCRSHTARRRVGGGGGMRARGRDTIPFNHSIPNLTTLYTRLLHEQQAMPRNTRVVSQWPLLICVDYSHGASSSDISPAKCSKQSTRTPAYGRLVTSWRRIICRWLFRPRGSCLFRFRPNLRGRR